MKKLTCTLIFVALSALLAPLTFADHHAVKVVKQENLGTYLTDAKGMTLYRFAKDQAGISACSGNCLEKWPAYYREHPAAPEGISADDFAAIKRADGVMQTTFRGYPLYYFFKDEMAGDAKGQGVKNVWFVINPDNFPNH